jgi:hypothetical protein
MDQPPQSPDLSLAIFASFQNKKLSKGKNIC